jgi:hypothetical protein
MDPDISNTTITSRRSSCATHTVAAVKETSKEIKKRIFYPQTAPWEAPGRLNWTNVLNRAKKLNIRISLHQFGL